MIDADTSFPMGMADAAGTPLPLAINSDAFMRGADISHVTDMERKNLLFYNTTDEQDLFSLIKERGLNSVRLRVWVNPAGPYYYSGIDDVVAKAVRAKNAGLSVMIDFHYSDSWADPKQQTIPAAWTSYDLDSMKAAVANHTTACLQALHDQHVFPDYVQVGNETDYGMLWPMGDIREGNMTNYAALFKAGYDAVKAIQPSAKVIVHFSKGYDQDNCAHVLDGLLANGATFDVIGISVYPVLETYHTDIDDSMTSLQNMSASYDKDAMVVECGYYQSDPKKARDMISRLLNDVYALPNGHGLGVYYWEPQYYNRPPINKSIFDASYKRPTEGIDGFSLLKNPGFEMDTIPALSPAGWITSGDNPDANYTEINAHTGTYRLTHYKSSGYYVETSQTITGLSNGLYTFHAWTRSAAGLLENYLFARGFGGTQLNINVPSGSAWTKIRLENIPVTNGQCEIGFYTRGNALYSSMDDVEFFKQ